MRDLDATIVANLARIPSQLATVVAPPGGDLVAASLVALYRQARIASSLERTIDAGARLQRRTARVDAAAEPTRRRTLLMYAACDRALPPNQVDALRGGRAALDPPLLGAVLATDDAAAQLDVVLERTAGPIVTSWQLPTSPWLAHTAVTLEGVLTRPAHRRGRRAGRGHGHATLRALGDIGLVFSLRPPRERSRTVAWLRSHGIGFRRLEMLGDRHTRRGQAATKARLLAHHDIDLMIDADLRTAQATAAAADRPVLAWDVQRTAVAEGGR